MQEIRFARDTWASWLYLTGVAKSQLKFPNSYITCNASEVRKLD